MATVCKWIETKVFPRLDNSFKESDEVSNHKGKAKAKVVNVQDYAVNVIWEWGEVFCGFGAYSVQEVFFRAGLFYCSIYTSNELWAKFNLTNYPGLSPFATTLEVFTVPSRIGRLLLGMLQFAKFDIEDLWYGSNLIVNL